LIPPPVWTFDPWENVTEIPSHIKVWRFYELRIMNLIFIMTTAVLTQQKLELSPSTSFSSCYSSPTSAMLYNVLQLSVFSAYECPNFGLLNMSNGVGIECDSRQGVCPGHPWGFMLMTSAQLLVQKLARRLKNSHQMFCFPSSYLTLFFC
jgi:hypothetical protein